MDFEVKGQQGMNIFSRGSIILDYGVLARGNSLKLKHITDGFVELSVDFI